jgi:hypothetical protein
MNEHKDVFKCMPPLFRINCLLGNSSIGQWKNNIMLSKGPKRWQYKGSWANMGEASWAHALKLRARHVKWRKKGATQLRCLELVIYFEIFKSTVGVRIASK